MKPDARITDIIESLADAEEYVRGIVGSFIEHGFDKQRSEIRIGVSGRGIYPNYSIIEPCEPQETVIRDHRGVPLKITKSVQSRIVLNGQSHREILDDSSWGENWSTAAMSFAEVQALLGELRRFKKKR
jgi:hypothetical protein